MPVYRLKSIRPWRMLLFGCCGCFIPLLVYIFAWESLDEQFKIKYDDVFHVLMIIVILISTFLAFLGFKISAYILDINMDHHGIYIEEVAVLNRKKDKHLFKWCDIARGELTGDHSGYILKIIPLTGKTISISEAFILSRDESFTDFLDEFTKYASEEGIEIRGAYL